MRKIFRSLGYVALAVLIATTSAKAVTVLKTQQGGTGTGNVFNEGSVVFAGPAGVYKQDNDNFFYDANSQSLSIGLQDTTAQLNIRGSTIGYGYFYAKDFDEQSNYVRLGEIHGNYGLYVNGLTTMDAEYSTADGDHIFSTGGGATEIARFTSTGALGIGTPTPGSFVPGYPYLLKVQSAGNFFSGIESTGASAYFSMKAAGTESALYWYTGGNASGSRQFRMDNTANGLQIDLLNDTATALTRTVAVFKADGKVGLGTSAPNVDFQIGDGTGTRIVAIDGGTGAAGGAYTIRQNGAYKGAFGTASVIQGSGTVADPLLYSYTGNLLFGTGTLERMRLDINGNFGIGGTPSYRFEVINTGGSPSTGDLAYMGVRTTGSSAYGAALNLDTTSVSGGRRWLMVSLGNLDAISTGGLAFYDASVGATRMLINTSGNVGIGTSSPGAHLDVAGAGKIASFGTVGSASDNYIHFVGTAQAWDMGVRSDNLFGIADSGVAYRFVIAPSTGNVGIGTTSPGNKLTVVDNATSDPLSLSTPSTNATNMILANTSSGGLIWAIGTNGSVPLGGGGVGDLNLYQATGSGTGNKLLIQAVTGNVGIGTTTPQARFEVQGLSSTAASNDRGPRALFNIDPSGNPSMELHAGKTGFSPGFAAYIDFGMYDDQDYDYRIITGNTARSAGFSSNLLFMVNDSSHKVQVVGAGDYSASSPWITMGSTGTVVGTATIAASAILQADSTTQGFLPPRMTTVQRVAISSPAEGLEVYDTTLHKLYVYDGTIWQAAW